MRNRQSIVVLGVLVVLSIIGYAALRRMSAAHDADRPRPTLGTGSGDERPELMVYCAAGIKKPVADLAAAFEAEYGVRVALQYGGSGTLLSNLQVAKQGDLYLAADLSYTQIAQEKGLLDETLPVAYLRPVILVASGNPKGIHTEADLARPDVRVALGNPDAASIGRQGMLLLQQAGVWEDVQANVQAHGVFKPTVPEVANDVKLGAADAAIVWDATAAQYDELEAVHTPIFDAGRKQVTIGVLKSSYQPTLALRFARYLNSEVGNAAFRAHGYETVDGDAWSWEPEITFFCGAVNRRAVEDVVARFATREGVIVNTVYNGCGILTAQMRGTGPEGAGAAAFPDVYMACDRYYLDTVGDWFQGDRDISSVDLVLVTPKENPAQIKDLQDLTRAGVRVVLGQPEQCTIGVLTRRLLEQEGVLDAVLANVLAEKPSSAMLVPAVTTGAADVAVAYRSDALAEQERLQIIAIDSPLARAVQPIGMARSSQHKYLAERLMQHVDAADAAFRAAGFQVLDQPTTRRGEGRP